MPLHTQPPSRVGRALRPGSAPPAGGNCLQGPDGGGPSPGGGCRQAPARAEEPGPAPPHQQGTVGPFQGHPFSFYSETICLRKRCRNSTKNCHIPLTQMSTFSYIRFTTFFLCMLFDPGCAKTSPRQHRQLQGRESRRRSWTAQQSHHGGPVSLAAHSKMREREKLRKEKGART